MTDSLVRDRRRAADVWWVQSVYVLPVHRRQGHFSAMYQHVRQEAERQGAAGVRLYADNSNTKAHAVVRAWLLPHACMIGSVRLSWRHGPAVSTQHAGSPSAACHLKPV